MRAIHALTTPMTSFPLPSLSHVDGGILFRSAIETHVTGTDLGSGLGAVTGTFESNELNGIAAESGLFPPYSIVDILVPAINGGILSVPGIW